MGRGSNKSGSALGTSPTLASIDLYKTMSGMKERRLTAALEKNSEVTSIELDGNQIGDEGVMRLAVALEEDATLTSIDLEHNEIGTKGAVHLAPVLEKNATMTHIDLPTR